MVSSDEINRRLNAKRRGVSYQERGTPPSTVNTVECPNCHTPNAPTAKFCVNCGEKLEAQVETVQSTGSVTKECPNCHFENPETSKFCVKCGEKLETEEGFTPEIKGPESEPVAKPTATTGTQRPDNFSGAGAQKVQPSSTSEKKLEPIVPPEPTPKPPEPPQVKRPATIPAPAAPEAKPTTDSDPVEKIKKAKGLLDIDAITQEEFDAIRNKYVEADADPVEKIKKAKGLLDSGVITQEEFNTIKAKYLDEI
jgi:hypothetical protein